MERLWVWSLVRAHVEMCYYISRTLMFLSLPSPLSKSKWMKSLKGKEKKLCTQPNSVPMQFYVCEILELAGTGWWELMVREQR